MECKNYKQQLRSVYVNIIKLLPSTIQMSFDEDDFFDPSQFDEELVTLEEMLQTNSLSRAGSLEMGRSRNNQQSSLQLQNAPREAKLVLGIMPSEAKKRTFIFGIPFFGYYCDITIESTTKTVQLSACKSNTAQIVIFDIYEYYGPTLITFSVFHKGFFSCKKVGTRSITLRDLLLLQDKSETLRGSKFQNLGSYTASSTSDNINQFWGCDAFLDIFPNHTYSSSSKSIKLKPSHKLHFHARFIPIKKCIPSNMLITSNNNSNSNFANGQISPATIRAAARERLRSMRTPAFTRSISSSIRHPSPLTEYSCGPMSTLEPPPLYYNEFQHAVCYGTSEIVEELLDSLGRKSLLRQAVAYRSIQSLPGPGQSNGGEKSTMSLSNISILEWSILYNNFQVTKMLLQRSGIFCFQNTAKNTNCTVHIACHVNNPHVVHTILKFLTKYHNSIIGWEGTLQDMINWKNQHQLTPLMYCCILGDSALQSVQHLLKYGSDVSIITTNTKQNALMMAISHQAYNICKLLLHETKSLSSLNLPHGQNAPTLALLKCGPGERDSEGMQPILYAAKIGSTCILNLLLSVGVPYDVVDKDDESCFHLIARYGHTDCCQILIEKESRLWKEHKDLNETSSSLQRMQYRPKLLLQCNVYGKRPIDIARENNNMKVVALLEGAVHAIYGILPTGSTASLPVPAISTEPSSNDVVGNSIESAVLETATHDTETRKAVGVEAGVTQGAIEGSEEVIFDDEADELDYDFALVRGPYTRAYHATDHSHSNRPKESIISNALSTTNHFSSEKVNDDVIHGSPNNFYINNTTNNNNNVNTIHAAAIHVSVAEFQSVEQKEEETADQLHPDSTLVISREHQLSNLNHHNHQSHHAAVSHTISPSSPVTSTTTINREIGVDGTVLNTNNNANTDFIDMSSAVPVRNLSGDSEKSVEILNSCYVIAGEEPMNPKKSNGNGQHIPLNAAGISSLSSSTIHEKMSSGATSLSHRLLYPSENKEKESQDIEVLDAHTHIIGV